MNDDRDEQNAKDEARADELDALASAYRREAKMIRRRLAESDYVSRRQPRKTSTDRSIRTRIKQMEEAIEKLMLEYVGVTHGKRRRSIPNKPVLQKLPKETNVAEKRRVRDEYYTSMLSWLVAERDDLITEIRLEREAKRVRCV